MNSETAKHVAVGGVVIAGGVTAIGQWAGGRNMPKLSIPLGVGIAAVGIAILAEWKPDIAASLGVLIALSATFAATDAMPGIKRALERAGK